MLSDLYPLLRAVQPADLNTTLNAVATALEGRGEQLGETLETLDPYLTRFNPELPGAHRGPAADRARSPTPTPTCCPRSRRSCATRSPPPRRSRAARTSSRPSSTTCRSSPSVAERFTRDNGDNLVRLADLGAAQLEVFARYAPGLPLPARRHRRCRRPPGRGVPRLHAAHRAGDAAQPAARLHRRGRAGLRRQARLLLRAAAEPAVVAGQPRDPPARLRRRRRRADRQGHQPRRARLVRRRAAGFAGGREETALLKALLAPGLGVSADDVPDLGVLLVGPMARGAEVSLR